MKPVVAIIAAGAVVLGATLYEVKAATPFTPHCVVHVRPSDHADGCRISWCYYFEDGVADANKEVHCGASIRDSCGDLVTCDCAAFTSDGGD